MLDTSFLTTCGIALLCFLGFAELLLFLWDPERRSVEIAAPFRRVFYGLIVGAFVMLALLLISW